MSSYGFAFEPFVICACVMYTISQRVAHLFALLIVILDKEKFLVLIYWAGEIAAGQRSPCAMATEPVL